MNKKISSEANEYTNMIDSVEDIVEKGEQYLMIKHKELNLDGYHNIFSKMNLWILFSILGTKLRAHNISDLNLSPNPEALPSNPTEKKEWDKMNKDTSKYAAIYAVCEGSQFLSEIKLLEGRSIPIDYASNIADDYSKLVLVRLLLNLPKSSNEIGIKGSKRSSEIRKDIKNNDELIILRAADNLLSEEKHRRNIATLIFNMGLTNNNRKKFSKEKIRGVLKGHPTDSYWRTRRK
jgi:hypothetical protein